MPNEYFQLAKETNSTIFCLNNDIDMTNIVDSLQLDSGTEIAALYTPNGYAVIEVQGEVKILFNENGPAEDGDWYRYPSEFPETLKEIIKSGSLSNDERAYVDANNWFEIFFYQDDTDCIPVSDCTDCEGETPEQIFGSMLDFINQCNKD